MTTMTDSRLRVTGGVDTHRDVHVVCALDERGTELGVESFPTNPGGYRQVLRWLRRFGEVDRVGVEGTGSYGAGLTLFLQGQGVTVLEINCPNRQRRRSHGKSDPVDAIAAARAVLSPVRPPSSPRQGSEMSRRFGLFASPIARPATTGTWPSTRCGRCYSLGPRS
jgi:transposase